MDVLENKNDLVKRYRDFVSDINDLTLRDKLNQVPSEKAYWAQILSDYEKALYKLQVKQKTIIKDLSAKLIEKSPVNLTKSVLDGVKDDASLDGINSDIHELELAIKHFSRIYENVKYIAKDFENILKYKQLQDS
jgi:hypothetical protein